MLWLPWGIADVWEQSYGYHLEVASDRTPGANLRKVLSTMGDRDAIDPRRRRAGPRLAIGLRRRELDPAPAESRLTSPDLLLLAWVGATLAGAAGRAPDVAPARVAAGARARAAGRSPPAVLAGAGGRGRPGAALLPRPRLARAAPGALRAASQADAVELLAALPDDALAISDDPGLVWRSGLRTPPDLVDASVLRIETGDITSDSLAEVAAEPDVCAVVVTSGERWGRFDDLPDRLADLGYELAAQDGDVHRVYVKPTAPGQVGPGHATRRRDAQVTACAICHHETGETVPRRLGGVTSHCHQAGRTAIGDRCVVLTP